MEKLAEISKIGKVADSIGYLRGEIQDLHRKTTSVERRTAYLDALELVAKLSASMLNLTYLIAKK